MANATGRSAAAKKANETHKRNKYKALRESNDAKGMSLADWYAYMETHTYAEWEQLLEKCVAMKQAEEPGLESGGANDNAEEL